MAGYFDSPEIEKLVTIVEEATRSSDEGVKRFVEPAPGTLKRVKTKTYQIVFGRRGSGKSSLLRKASADLANNRQPIAYVDLETFKGQSYPDALLGVLIQVFEKFAEWLRASSTRPAHRRSLFKRLFEVGPQQSGPNRKRFEALASELHNLIIQLRNQLKSADNLQTEKTVKQQQESTEQVGLSGRLALKPAGVSGQIGGNEKLTASKETRVGFQQSKLHFLQASIVDYQNIFRQIARLAEGDSYLFLDDLYHIKRPDQARVIDYFHRIAKGNNLWLKIGTIRHRSQWYIHADPPIGLKLGDDASEINLDLTLEKYNLAKEFLIKILRVFLDECGGMALRGLLTLGAVNRLVLASGGVARDFLGVFRRAVDVARNREIVKRRFVISAEDINIAAGEYYRSKREEFRRDTDDNESKLEREFQNIVAFCLYRARTNIFLLNKNAAYHDTVSNIQELADLRLLHLVNSRVRIRQRGEDVFEAFMPDLGEYAGARIMKDLEIIEFWHKGSKRRLCRKSLVYDPYRRIPYVLATKKQPRRER